MHYKLWVTPSEQIRRLAISLGVALGVALVVLTLFLFEFKVDPIIEIQKAIVQSETYEDISTKLGNAWDKWFYHPSESPPSDPQILSDEKRIRCEKYFEEQQRLNPNFSTWDMMMQEDKTICPREYLKVRKN